MMCRHRVAEDELQRQLEWIRTMLYAVAASGAVDDQTGPKALRTMAEAMAQLNVRVQACSCVSFAMEKTT